MSSRRFINELGEQEAIDQVFRVADKQLRANRQGGKYILLRLADRTGHLVAMHWNADERVFESFDRGDFLRCKGRSQLYNGALQMIVSQLERVESQEVDVGEFDSFDSAIADRLLLRLAELIAGIKDESLRNLAKAYLHDAEWISRFKVAPAAVANHHAYPGGLLQHTVNLMELALLVAPRYPQMNTELVLVGAFLHDLGKVDELAAAGEMTYTDRGQFIGHLVIGVQQLGERIRDLGSKFPDILRWQLEHMILSHHGQLEFGSPKVPLTLEALALHHLDNLDAKIACATSVIAADVSTENSWTNYNPAMGRKLWKSSRNL